MDLGARAGREIPAGTRAVRPRQETQGVPDWTDRELARLCADGDEAGWTELVARHGDRILRVLRRALGRRAGGDPFDLRQDLYARLLSRGGGALRALRADRPGALAAFLARAALRVAIDHARREARAPARAGEVQPGDLAAPGASPEQAAERAEALRRLDGALPRACEGPRAGRDRAVLCAHLRDGCNPAEIARLGCGLSPKGVETLLRRTRRRLAAQLRDEETAGAPRA
ncbi:MAG: hypothetical protein NVSMB23_23930 [Myxococcales bacterium]